MRRSLIAIVAVVSLGALYACGGDEEDELPEVDCAGTVPTYADLKKGPLATCIACHDSAKSGAARVDAPTNVNYDTYASAKAKAEDAASEVNEGAMPPKPLPALSDADKQLLYKWALCGTPE